MYLPYQMLPPIKVKQFNILNKNDRNEFNKIDYEIKDEILQPKDLYEQDINEGLEVL